MLSKEYIDLLEDKLFLSCFLTDEEIKIFHSKILEYIGNRTPFETFKVNLDNTILFFEKVLGYNYNQIITCIGNWPSVIHADKEDLFYKYLLLSKVHNINRDDIFVNHPKDLMIGLNLLNARIEFFSSDESENLVRKKEITRRKLFKTTSQEFEISYSITKEQLLKKYPYDERLFGDLFSNDCNRLVVVNYSRYKNGYEIVKKGMSDNG